MKAGDFSPHVVLVDVQTDVIDAKEIIKNLRSNSSLAATRVIALAGSLTGVRKRALLRQGFDDAVAGPYKFDDLVKAIEAATDLLS